MHHPHLGCLRQVRPHGGGIGNHQAGPAGEQPFAQPVKPFPFRPGFVGQPEADVVMGKGSGMDSIKVWLEKFQMKASDEQMTAILLDVKRFGLDHKRLLTDEEFKTIANGVLEGAAA